MAGATVAMDDTGNAGRRPIEVAAGVVFRDGKLLITLRLPDAHLGGLWEFPGGKREPGESFEQCLRRELTEELGIEVEVHDVIEELTHDYADRTVLLKFFRCRWLRNEPKAILCHDFAWIDSAQLANYAFPDADARLLDKIRRDWGQLVKFQ